jgi:hypothetical protein
VYKDISPVDGSPILVFPRSEATKRQAISSTTSAFFVVCVLASVIGIFAAKFILEADDSISGWASLIFSLLNALVVAIMSNVYTAVAHFLTDYENHRTAVEYVLCPMFFLPFLVCHVSVSLLSIYCCLPAFSDTT